jgi:hypothetical protein
MAKFFALKFITYMGRRLTKGKFGSQPGSIDYFDSVTGWHGDFWPCLVLTMNGRSAALSVNASGLRVTLDNPPGWLREGFWVLAAPLAHRPDGMHTDAVFPGESVAEPPPPKRKTGTIYRCLNPRCGFARNGDGTEVRVDIEAFLDSCSSISVGQRISYIEVPTDKGMRAGQIRWA